MTNLATYLHPTRNPADRKESRRELNPQARTVLVVDDQKTIRRAVTRILKALDPHIEVYHSNHGSDALVRLNEMRVRHAYEPSLMVVDLEMPVMTGWELIERLQKDYLSLGRTSGIPIVVLSATDGTNGIPILGKSIHKGTYQPLVAVSKLDCEQPDGFDTTGEHGLTRWLEHFLQAPSMGRTPSPHAGRRFFLKGVH